MSHMPHQPEDAQHPTAVKTHSQHKTELRLISLRHKDLKCRFLKMLIWREPNFQPDPLPFKSNIWKSYCSSWCLHPHLKPHICLHREGFEYFETKHTGLRTICTNAIIKDDTQHFAKCYESCNTVSCFTHLFTKTHNNQGPR